MNTYIALINISNFMTKDSSDLIVMSFLKGFRYVNPLNQNHDFCLIILRQTLIAN
jgi:hypothetical protein